MPPRKRARATASPEAEAEAEASHLVSFLTGYAEREASSGESSSDGGDEHEDLDDSEDEQDELHRTPSKRGLIGTPSNRKRKPSSAASTPRKRTPAKPKEDEGFVRLSRADAYFLSASSSARSSGASYAALARPLSQAEYEAAANGVRSADWRVQKVIRDWEAYFAQWAAELEAGFNLLLYGYGSKRRLVNRFVMTTLSKRGHAGVVNGHFPGLSLRDVLASLEDTLGIPDAPAAPGATPLERAAVRLYAHFSIQDHRPLYLVLHNIDAPALRTPKALAALSLLGCCAGIHLIATFDHVHTPLLFSSTLANTPPHAPRSRHSKLAIAPERGFNWIYHSVPTLDDYDVELSYARLSASALGALGHGGAAGVSEEGALQILRSVPDMAKRLLKLIVTRQLGALGKDAAAHAAFPPGQVAPAFGLDVELVQKAARDRFIAREEERFNAFLGEFRDHGLVVLAELDGEGRSGRWLWVPLGRSAVERVLEEMRDVEA